MPSNSPPQSKPKPPSRTCLRLQAQLWRSAESLGMGIDSWAFPHPISPSFKRTVQSTFTPGSFDLYFYVPASYSSKSSQTPGSQTQGPPVSQGSQDTPSEQASSARRYPIILNFHGGGFTIGKATDDARFCSYLLEREEIIVVSVEYRLAPEFPFPTGVQDGVSTLQYLTSHAEELKLDMERVIMNGFSCGGNFAFTVTLMYNSLASTEEEGVDGEERGEEVEEPDKRDEGKKAKILAITSFYPPVDFTLGRTARRISNPSPSHELPATLTNLFDFSYLHPPSLNLSDPFISPGVANSSFLIHHLPTDILIYTCEYDGLQKEGEAFAKRLEGLGKDVRFRMVEGVRHAWDKMPNFGWERDDGVRDVYGEVLDFMREVLGSE